MSCLHRVLHISSTHLATSQCPSVSSQKMVSVGLKLVHAHSPTKPHPRRPPGSFPCMVYSPAIAGTWRNLKTGCSPQQWLTRGWYGRQPGDSRRQCLFFFMVDRNKGEETIIYAALGLKPWSIKSPSVWIFKAVMLWVKWLRCHSFKHVVCLYTKMRPGQRIG